MASECSLIRYFKTRILKKNYEDGPLKNPKSATGSCNGVGCSTDVGSISWKTTWSGSCDSDLCNSSSSSCCLGRLPAQQTPESLEPSETDSKKYDLARRRFSPDERRAECDRSTNKLCRRPPQYAPPLQVDLLTLKAVSKSRDMGYLYANFSLPRPLCSWLRPGICDRQADVRRKTSDRHHHLNSSCTLQSCTLPRYSHVWLALKLAKYPLALLQLVFYSCPDWSASTLIRTLTQTLTLAVTLQWSLIRR